MDRGAAGVVSEEVSRAGAPPGRARRLAGVWIVGALMLASSFAASLGFGAVELEPMTIVGVLGQRLGLLDAAVDPVADAIVWSLRLPRTLVAALVGAALAIAGGMMQGLFRNPLASPSIIGASEGAALGAVVALAFGLADRSLLALPVLAVLGSLAALAAVTRIATVDGRSPIATLLLAGVALAAFLSAVNTFLIASAWEDDFEAARRIAFWLMGGITDRGWIHVAMVLPGLLAGLAVALLCARDLDLLAEGEEAAAALGVDAERSRSWLLVASAVLVGSAVAVSGVVGFVGLVVPHLVRLVIGPAHARLLPAAALTGAWLVIVADLVARAVIAPRELHLGVVTAFLGAPFFLFLLRRHRRQLVL